MTMHATATGRASTTPNAASVIAVVVMAIAGYLAATNLHVVAAFAGALALAAWGAVAFQYPRAAVSTSFVALLFAGTKFRTRDATDSLAGVMDAQIALELALFAAVGAAVVAVWIAGRYDRRRLSATEGLILGYAALALLSTSWSLAPSVTFVRATQLAIVSALALLAVRVVAPSRALWTACSALAVYVIACACSTLIVAPAWEDYSAGDFRFAWFAVHPIAAGTLAAIAALGTLSATVFRQAGGVRILGLPRILVMLALIAVLVLTNARGPLLAFLAAAGVLLMMRMHSALRILVVIVATSSVLVYLMTGADFHTWMSAAAEHDSTLNRMFFRGQTADTVLELNGRLGLWDDLRPAIAAHVLLGYGYQASRAVVLDTAPWAGYAHNALLQVMLDLGVTGTLALIGLVVVGLAGAFRSALNPWERATVVALLVFLLLNSVSSESFAGAPGFETLLLLMCVLCAAYSSPAPTASTQAQEADA